LISGGAAAALLLTASTVFAHIDLVGPVSRYVVNRANGGGGSKSCPCGGPESVIDPDRVCNVPADQSTDPNRSTKVTTFEAGEKIQISVVEYVNHSGRFRVAFDDDGADMTDFNKNILLDVPDDATKKGGTNNAPYTFEVTLPMTTCENCTLQVIQDMNNNTTTPVKDPAGDSTYYTCADIRIVPTGTMGTDNGNDDGMDPADPTPPANNGMPMGTTPPANNGNTNGAASGSNMGTNLGTVPMMGDNNSGSATPGMTGSGTTGMTNSGTTTGVGSLMPGMSTGNTLQPSNGAPITSSASESDDSGGCSFGGRTPASPFAALAMAGLATTLVARRRRQK